MKLVNMKMSDEEKSEQMGASQPAMPDYAYGLRICLDDDAIEKLGLKKLPPFGSTLLIEARVEVVSMSEDKSGDESEQRLGLQITDMAIGKEKAQPADAAKVLYGKS